MAFPLLFPGIAGGSVVVAFPPGIAGGSVVVAFPLLFPGIAGAW